MVDLRPRTPPKKLKAVLAIRDSFKFLNALTDLAVPPGTSWNPPPDKRHELRQMIVTVRALFLCVETDGIWKFLIEDGAAEWFAKAQTWLRRIEATRGLDYLNATARAFPRGLIPADDSKRESLLLESQKVETRLRELDRAYKGSMAECLRVHIREHYEQFRVELEDEPGDRVQVAIHTSRGPGR